MSNNKLNLLIPALLFLFLLVILPYLPGFEFDIRGGFQTWALYIHQNGLRNAYGSDTDYMPLYQYFLWLYGKIAGSDDAIIKYLPYLRCFTLAFDYLGLWYVYKWTDKKTPYYAILAICILNVGWSYDTLIWGQADGILAALLFICLYYAWKKNNTLSAVILVLALNFKIISVIILPVWGLLFIYNMVDGKPWKQIALPLAAAIVAQFALLIPFAFGQRGMPNLLHVVSGSFSAFQSISIKAGNMWHWLVKGNLLYADDSKIWIAGLTYKQVGLFLFFSISFLAILPMILLVYKRWKTANKAIQPNRELIWLTSAMVFLLFYFLCTEIHERYCQPAFIFITALAFFTGDLLIYALFSIMYFLTLEVSMQSLHLHNYETLIFDFRFLAGINVLIIILLARKIYKNYKAAVAIA